MVVENQVPAVAGFVATPHLWNSPQRGLSLLYQRDGTRQQIRIDPSDLGARGRTVRTAIIQAFDSLGVRCEADDDDMHVSLAAGLAFPRKRPVAEVNR